MRANPELKAKWLEGINRREANPEYQAERLERLNQINASRKGSPRTVGAGTPCVALKVLDTLNNLTTVYPSIAEAAKAIGTVPSSISLAFKRKGEDSILIKNKRYCITKLPNNGGIDGGL